jgi:hypothetical protein
MVRVQLSIFLLLLQGDIIVANSQLAANGPNAAIASGTNILIGASYYMHFEWCNSCMSLING